MDECFEVSDKMQVPEKSKVIQILLDGFGIANTSKHLVDNPE
jgi:hypothetical protein